MVKRNVITDACLYIGVNNDCFGRASKVTPPTIKHGKVTLKDLATMGELSLSNGKIEGTLETKVTLNSFYEDVFNKISNPFKAVDLKICSNVMEFENDDVTSNTGMTLFMRGRSDEFGLLGELNEHDNMNHEITFHCSMVRLVKNGKELYYIDIANNIWIVNGIDIRKDIIKNLGLS